MWTNKRLVRLPREPSADAVFALYVAHKQKQRARKAASLAVAEAEAASSAAGKKRGKGAVAKSKAAKAKAAKAKAAATAKARKARPGRVSAAEAKAARKFDRELVQFVASLRAYFASALPRMLLYRFERPQYANYAAQLDARLAREADGGGSASSGDKAQAQLFLSGQTMACAYGAEHLLRLIVKLPEIFARAQLTTKAWLDVKARILDFVAFLKSNVSRFFSAAYDPVHKVYLDAVDNDT